MNKQELQNQVSIIINGVRYDAVETDTKKFICHSCDLHRGCKFAFCGDLLEPNQVFKKSNKKFEK